MADNTFERFRTTPAVDSGNSFSRFAARPSPAAPPPTATPVAKKPERSWGEFAGDTALAVGKGVVDVAKSSLQITSMANPSSLARRGASALSNAIFGQDLVPTEREAVNTLASAASRAVGRGDVQLGSRADMLDAAGRSLEGKQSAYLQGKKQELADTKGFFASAKKVVTDSALLGNFVAEQVPNLAFMGYGTGASGASAALRAGAPVLERALASGATRGAAEALAKRAGDAAGKEAAERFVLGSNTVMESGSAADQAYRDALSQPDEVWQSNPEYRRQVAAGTPADRVKEQMAQSAARQAAVITAPLSLAAGKLVAPFEADVWRGRLARKPMAVASGVAREAAEEGIQEGGSQFATNAAMQPIDPNRRLLEGVPEAAGTGAALGGVLGGVLGGAGVAASDNRVARRPQPPELPAQRPAQSQDLPAQTDAAQREDTAAAPSRAVSGLTPEQRGAAPHQRTAERPVPFPTAAAGSLSDIANTVSMTAAAPSTPTVDEWATNPFLRRQSPTADNASAQPVVAAAAEAEAVAAAPKAEDAVPPGYAPPWVDSSTGEFRQPSQDEIKAAIHDSMNFMNANGVGIHRPAIKRALGLKGREFDAAWSATVSERKAGLSAPATPQFEQVPNSETENQPARAGEVEDIAPPVRDADTAPVPAAGRDVDPVEIPAAQEPANDDAPAAVRAEEAVAPAPAAASTEGTAAPTYNESSEILDSDITPPSGGAFSQRGAAEVQARRVDGGRVFEVDGGFVVRTPQARGTADADADVDAARSDSAAGTSEATGADAAGQIDASESGPTDGGASPDGEAAPIVHTLNEQPATERPTVEKAPDAIAPTSAATGAEPSEPPVPESGSPVTKTSTPAPTLQEGKLPQVRVRGGKPYYDTTSRKTIEAYFQPGRVVPSYGGRDRVIEVRHENDGRWSVKVQALDVDGNPAKEDGRPALPRWHSTAPTDRELRAVFGQPQKRHSKSATTKATTVYSSNDNREPAAPIAAAAAEAATSPTNDRPLPTDAQKEAGNYKKGHVRLHGHDISIENPAGSRRQPQWPALKNHYGYFKGTVGKDKDHVDVFLTNRAHEPELPVFVIDQVNKDGSFDEHKVVMGSPSESAARRAYLANYEKGWTGLGAITQMSQTEFKEWLRDPAKTKRPAGKLAKPEVATNTETKASAGKPAADAEPSSAELFSRTDSSGDRKGIPFDRALQLKRELTASWGDRAPNVVVIQNADGFPDAAKSDPAFTRAEGFYDGRDTVWINAGNIATEARFRAVLAHEALGHYGVERVVGAKNWAGIVEAIANLETTGKGSAALQSVLADVRARYGALDATTFAKEAIAVMAERGMRNSFVQRVTAAVRRLLRRLMPTATWSETEVRELLSRADSFLRAGPDLARRQATAQAYAFSRPRAEASVAGNGERSIKMGGETFVERSGTFYMINGTGQPKDFRVFSQALDAAAASGGEVRLDDATEGERPSYSVVVPDLVAREAFISRGGFSLPPAPATPTFAEQVRQRLASKDPRAAALTLGRTPAVLRMLGVPDLPLTMPSSVLLKVASGKGGMRPELTERQIVRLPELLDEPLAVMDSSTADNALVVMTKARDGKGNPIVVSVAIDRAGQGNPTLKVNVVTSAYGKEGAGWLEREAAAGRVRYSENGAAPDRQVSTDAALNLRVEPDGQRPSVQKVLSAADLRNFREAQRNRAFSGPGLFSKPPADIVADIEAVMNPARAEGAIARAKQWLADVTPKKLKDQSRAVWLGALSTQHLTELGGDYFRQIHHYSDFLSEMQADRNTLQAEGETIAEDARKWAGKHRAEARALFDLMHEATIDGVDPAEAYQPLQFRFGGELHAVTKKSVREARQALREQMLGRSGDSKNDMMNERKLLSTLPGREEARKLKYPTLVDKWNQLSPEAQQHYRAFRDLYRKRSDQVEQALVDRINDTDAPDQHKRRIIDVIRKQFEANRLQGVYFPLQRFGRYFVSAERDGTPTFLMFEKLSDLERAVRGLKGRGFSIKAQGLKQAGKAADAPSGTFVAEVIGALQSAHVSTETQDQIYQIYLQSLPEMSMRKHQIHRQSVPGWDPDAIRAFAHNVHHGAHQLARMRFSHKLQAVLDLLKKHQDAARKEEASDTRKIAAGDAILDELHRRHEWIMNPTDSQLTNLVSSAGFIYYLGATPAAALVNLTQTALVSYPYLAARYGGVRAMNALLAASKDAIRTVGNIQKTLTDPEEQAAHRALMASGAIDKTQAHNLAGIAEGGLQGYNPAWARAMEFIGWGFHKTEVVNREATGLAAFRLARAEGMPFDEAVKFAHRAIVETHFDYSNANRPRYLTSGAAKVLLMFKQYSLNMTWMLGRTVWQAVKNESPEVRRIARRQLTGILGMSAVFSGALGLPQAGVVAGTLNALASTFGDDDEPWDAETEFGAFLSDMLGPTAADLILHGAVNQVTGADIAGRVGLSELWFRDADRELEGRGLYYNILEQLAGPMGGVLKNVIVGKNMIDEGHVWRGVETMLPKSLKDIMKGIRYAREGVNTLRGDALLEDRSLFDTLLQVNGFSPARVAERYERNRALTNYQDHILKRRQHLMDAFAMALRLGDGSERATVMAKITHFNKANPEVAITPATIRNSIQSRARYSAKAEAGIVLNPKLASRLQAAVGE